MVVTIGISLWHIFFFYISWVYARYMYGHKAFVAKADYTGCAENLLSKDTGEVLISFFGIFYA